jgi:hypothetical protein
VLPVDAGVLSEGVQGLLPRSSGVSSRILIYCLAGTGGFDEYRIAS